MCILYLPGRCALRRPCMVVYERDMIFSHVRRTVLNDRKNDYYYEKNGQKNWSYR